MIDPFNLVRPVINSSELALFACSVQGKQAAIQSDKLNSIFEILYEMLPVYENMPFACIRALNDEELLDVLKQFRMGQYGRLIQSYRQLSYFKDDHKFTLSELTNIFGVGPKTARFILGYGWNEPCAILDVHILKYLRQCGIDAPQQTPQDANTYLRLEREYFVLAEKAGLSTMELDEKIWKEYST